MLGENSILTGHRVLVADDEPFSRLFVVRIIRDLGCPEVIEAASGAETLERLKAEGDQVPIVILDFVMPNGNGLEVLKLIRTGKAGVPSEIPVLMLTGNSDFDLAGAAIALDVDSFLIKPTSKAIMHDALAKLLSDTDRKAQLSADYEAVDIEPIGKRLLRRKPVGASGAKPPKADLRSPAGTVINTPSPTTRMKLENIPSGTILAEHIRSPGGALLLGAPTMLTDRLLGRLRELREAMGLEFLTVFEGPREKT
jgi:CheY-like chemotaxis protein